MIMNLIFLTCIRKKIVKKDLITLPTRDIPKEFFLRVLLIRESSLWKLKYEEQI